MTLDPLLIQVLACPEDKGPLLYFADEQVLFNPRLHRTYPVRDGIPVLLIDEATTVDAAEDARLNAKAEAGGAVTTRHRRRRVTATAGGRRFPGDLGRPRSACPSRWWPPPRRPGTSTDSPPTTTSRTWSCWGWGTAASWATC